MSASISLHDGTGIIADVPGYGAVLACGVTVPTDGRTGFAIGCLFVHLDGGAGTALYCNEGTADSCDFDSVTVS